MVEQCRYFRIRIYGHKVTTELVSIPNIDQVRIVFSALFTERQEFFKHNRNFHAIWCSQRIQLQGMVANGQCFVVRTAGYWAVDAGEFSAAL